MRFALLDLFVNSVLNLKKKKKWIALVTIDDLLFISISLINSLLHALTKQVLFGYFLFGFCKKTEQYYTLMCFLTKTNWLIWNRLVACDNILTLTECYNFRYNCCKPYNYKLYFHPDIHPSIYLCPYIIHSQVPSYKSHNYIDYSSTLVFIHPSIHTSIHPSIYSMLQALLIHLITIY